MYNYTTINVEVNSIIYIHFKYENIKFEYIEPNGVPIIWKQHDIFNNT